MNVDINSDMGEGFGIYKVCDDETLMNTISSANIACGLHAGDPFSMVNMVRLAKLNGVDVGAHPGLPDRLGFGRKEIPFTHDEICQLVAYQIGALVAIANAEDVPVTHVSFHAALGNMINRDERLANQVMALIAGLYPNLAVFSLPHTIIQYAALNAGLKSRTLFLVDRAYTKAGTLVPRGSAGAVISDETQVRQRVRQFLLEQTVTTHDGDLISLEAKSILIHSDTPGSERLATIVRDEIETLGGTVTPMSQLF